MSMSTGPDTSKHIEAQVIPVSASTKALQAAMVEADIIQQGRGGDAELAFLADMPPLAYVTFTVHKGSQGLAAASSSISSRSDPPAGQHGEGVVSRQGFVAVVSQTQALQDPWKLHNACLPVCGSPLQLFHCKDSTTCP